MTAVSIQRLGTILLVLNIQLLLGCKAQPNFKAITASFNASKGSGVSKIEPVPIHVGTSFQRLSKAIVIANTETNSAIVQEIAFTEYPRLPKEMGHSGAIAACKMLIYFRDGKVFCFYVLFREGAAGAGVEYAIHPNMNLTSAHDNDLPGNHTLGRGYSIKLYKILNTLISGAGEGWVENGW